MGWYWFRLVQESRDAINRECAVQRRLQQVGLGLSVFGPSTSSCGLVHEAVARAGEISRKYSDLRQSLFSQMLSLISRLGASDIVYLVEGLDPPAPRAQQVSVTQIKNTSDVFAVLIDKRPVISVNGLPAMVE